MNDSDSLRIKALQGIVKSGSKLHIDVSNYSQELSREKHYNYNKPKSKKNKKIKNIKVKSSHKLKSVTWQGGKLVLKFNKKLRNNQLNYFTLYDKKRKKYKYVFDIHASMLTKSQTLRKNGVDRIKLAQYNSNTLRLVIENTKKLSVHFSKKERRIEITISSHEIRKNSILTSRIKKSPTRLDKNKVIVIDAGHGGKDPGAIGYTGYREKVIVLAIAKELSRILKARGYKVYMTRKSDKFIKLRNRTKFANRKNADIFISIHANAVSKRQAHKARGIECYFLATSRSKRAKKVAEIENSASLEDMNFYGKESFLNTLNSHNIVAANKLAIDLQRSALSALKKKYKYVKDAGVREGPFWVLVGAQMPAVLVEVGFISNPQEAKKLVKKEYQKTMAKGLANGVERYFINSKKR
ncbi:N-acetylmuramoyl-L-alanine amidase [Sulfurimonas sp.]|uniref:N-acetylmuramoyl-L-alanine amidase family protein n=1 Tax=Sulfurimonas sp. TaxID=2022749 RepID=UPI00263409E6|nr:N-acetylmuramoyl-L-alanine amidase [Sulfurimonas sp.]